MLNAHKVFFFGVGDSYSVALSAMYKFSCIGIVCNATNDLDHMLKMASQLSENDVVVLISYSGKSQAIINVAKELKRMKKITIAITNYPVSPLAKGSNIVLLTSAFQEYGDGEVMAVKIVQYSIIESLFICLLLKTSKPFY